MIHGKRELKHSDINSIRHGIWSYGWWKMEPLNPSMLSPDLGDWCWVLKFVCLFVQLRFMHASIESNSAKEIFVPYGTICCMWGHGDLLTAAVWFAFAVATLWHFFFSFPLSKIHNTSPFHHLSFSLVFFCHPHIPFIFYHISIQLNHSYGSKWHISIYI